MMPDRQKLKDNFEFIVDCARFAEGIVTEADVKKKYRFNDATWTALGEDDDLLRAITDEKIRRIRNGSSKREKAQGLITKAPDILDSIMSDASASPRHRVDAIKALNSFTGNPSEGAPAADRFLIRIDLGAGEFLTFDKSISINANDGDPSATSASLTRSSQRRVLANAKGCDRGCRAP